VRSISRAQAAVGTVLLVLASALVWTAAAAAYSALRQGSIKGRPPVQALTMVSGCGPLCHVLRVVRR
jgi:hypothetical protein